MHPIHSDISHWIRAHLIVLLVLLSPLVVGAQNQSAAPANVVFILFDPTILQPGDSKGRDQWIEKELRSFYLKIPENTFVSVYIIDRGMTNSGPIYERLFEFRREFGGPRKHQEALQKSFDDDLSKKLAEEWNKAHDKFKDPTSCLVSALYAVQKHLGSYSSNKGQYNFYLLLVSDMLESCDEWGFLINFDQEEKKLQSELQKVDLEKIAGSIDLSKLNKLVVVQVPNKKIVTPLGNDQLEAFWKKFVAKVRIKPENYYHGSRFPIHPPWSK